MPSRAPSATTTFGETVGFVSYVVPATGVYDVLAFVGQGGGGAGGFGAEAGGEFNLAAGETLNVAVGAVGNGGGRTGGGRATTPSRRAAGAACWTRARARTASQATAATTPS